MRKSMRKSMLLMHFMHAFDAFKHAFDAFMRINKRILDFLPDIFFQIGEK